MAAGRLGIYGIVCPSCRIPTPTFMIQYGQNNCSKFIQKKNDVTYFNHWTIVILKSFWEDVVRLCYFRVRDIPWFFSLLFYWKNFRNQYFIISGSIIQVVTHLCMEAMLGSLCITSYCYLKLAKMLCLSYYCLCFLLNKITEQEGGTDSAQKWGSGGRQGTGERWPSHMYTNMNRWINNKKLKLKLTK
jgi:hypothetical protein